MVNCTPLRVFLARTETSPTVDFTNGLQNITILAICGFHYIWKPSGLRNTYVLYIAREPFALMMS